MKDLANGRWLPCCERRDTNPDLNARQPGWDYHPLFLFLFGSGSVKI